VEEIIIRLELSSVAFFALVTTTDARHAGLSDRVLAKLVSTGRWVRMGRGVFAVATLDGGRLQACAAALLVAGPSAFLHLTSAAAVFGGLDLDPTTEPRLAVARGANGTLWPRRSVAADAITVVNGLRTTTPRQTLVDLAGELDERRWEWALEAALRNRLVTIAEIDAAIVAPGRHDPVALGVVESVLGLRPQGAPATGSLLETRFIQLARDAGLPDPQRQYRVLTPGGRHYFLDVCWPEVGLFVELDGQQHADQPVYDAHRHMTVVNLTGFLGIRMTWDQVTRRPRSTGRDLVLTYNQAKARPQPS
jgi:very-short-patch-repair endonuclease